MGHQMKLLVFLRWRAAFSWGSRSLGVASLCLILLASFASAEIPREVSESVLRGHWADVVRRVDGITTSDPALRVALARQSALALTELGKSTEALALVDKTLKDFPKAAKGVSKEKARLNDSLREWLQLDRAQILMSQPKKRSQGLTVIEQLSRSANSEVAPVALYLLASERARAEQIDGAALAFNLRREAYPEAVGEEQLIDLLAGDEGSEPEVAPQSSSTAISTTPSTSKNSAKSTSADESVSRATNTRYAIQLGVFATKANADAMLVKVSTKRLIGTIEKKLVSGKNYYAALVGSFLDLASAQAVRDSLESVHNASFTVITR